MEILEKPLLVLKYGEHYTAYYRFEKNKQYSIVPQVNNN